MKITSTSFIDRGQIPQRYTCDGEGINPPLTFTDVPSSTKSLVLLMDDPDVPGGGVFDHWVVYNISPTITEIAEMSVPPGVEGLNGAKRLGYYAACPPDREHRYFFKLYALDKVLVFDQPESITKQMVIEQMQGHILDQSELVGLYNRPQNR